MRISSCTSLESLPVEAQIDGELMRIEQDQIKADGNTTVDLIESAAPQRFVNRPLTSGPIGRRINIGV